MENTKIKLSALWISHFLLWTYSDMLTIMQGFAVPVNNNLLLFVAVPLAIIQVTMILLSLICKRKIIRIINFVIAPIFFVFNIMNIFDSHVSWEYLLTAAFVVINFLCIITVIKWKSK